MPHNYSLEELARYTPEAITQDTLIDLMAELDAYRKVLEDRHCYDPEELASYIEELESNQENPDHADYYELKSFFEDCVDSLNAHWPRANAYDQKLRKVIMEAISKGDCNGE